MVPGPLCGPGRGMMAHARVEGCWRREEMDGFKAQFVGKLTGLLKTNKQHTSESPGQNLLPLAKVVLPGNSVAYIRGKKISSQ